MERPVGGAAILHDVETSHLNDLLPLYLGALHGTIPGADTQPCQFCPEEPLRLEDAAEPLGNVTFGPTPGPFSSIPTCCARPHDLHHDGHALDVGMPFLPSNLLAAHGCLDNCVPYLVHTCDNFAMFGAQSWDESFCGMFDLTFTNPTMKTWTNVPTLTDRIPADLSQISTAEVAKAYACSASNDVSCFCQGGGIVYSRDMSSGGTEQGLHSKFCPDEPLQLEDTFVSAYPRAHVGLKAEPGEHYFPALSPWKDGRLREMVQNTFIHTVSSPLTPVAGTRRRSLSLPKNLGSARGPAAAEEQHERGQDNAGCKSPNSALTFQGIAAAADIHNSSFRAVDCGPFSPSPVLHLADVLLAT